MKVKAVLLGELYANGTQENESFSFVMVKWYDYCLPTRKEPEPLDIFGCPRVKMLKEYNIVPLESVVESVHVIPRFHKENQYLVNKYIF